MVRDILVEICIIAGLGFVMRGYRVRLAYTGFRFRRIGS